MKDEKVALELLKIQQMNGTYLTKDEMFNTYTYYLDKLENIDINNKIAKIKNIFKDNESISGAWTGINGINMLDKITKIIENKEGAD